MTVGDSYRQRFPGYMPENEAAAFAKRQSRQQTARIAAEAREARHRTIRSWQQIFGVALPLLVEHAHDESVPIEIEGFERKFGVFKQQTRRKAGWLILKLAGDVSADSDSAVDPLERRSAYVLTENAEFGKADRVARGVKAYRFAPHRSPVPILSESALDNEDLHFALNHYGPRFTINLAELIGQAEPDFTAMLPPK